MLKRRVPRLLVSGFLLLVATSGLSACRTAPNVAAYVGDEQVTVSELDAAVEDRLADEDVAAYAEDQGEDYTSTVLTRLVDEKVYDAAAERYDVQVSDTAVRSRIDQLLDAQGQDPDEAYAGLAQRGYSRADVFEQVRELMLRQEIAKAAGQADALSEESLRADYEATQASSTAVALGYITVPDQATADATLARLTASPADYPAVAAQYPGPSTLPEVQAFAPDQIPGVLAAGVQAAAPNTGFTTPVADAGGIVVTFVQGTPTFEQMRASLEQQAGAQVDQAGAALVSDVKDDLHVRTNPRYDDRATSDDPGVVDILESGGTSAG